MVVHLNFFSIRSHTHKSRKGVFTSYFVIIQAKAGAADGIIKMTIIKFYFPFYVGFLSVAYKSLIRKSSPVDLARRRMAKID